MNERALSYELRAASTRAAQMRTTRASRLAPSAPPRRGILLLVVLSMLTLFLLIGTAFIVSSNQYRQANKIRAKLTEASNSSIDQQDLLNEVINQLVRDTNNPNSAIRFHSLLRDMYGNDGATIGLSQSVSFLTRNIGSFDGFGLVDRTGQTFTVNALDQSMNSIGDQFFWVAVRFEDRTANSVALPLSLNDDYYNGRLFTFTEGELQGVTARVMRYTVLRDQAGSAFRYAIFTLMPLNADEPIRSLTLTTQANAASVDPWLRTEAVLNGLPFNGTGMGFNRLAAIGPKLNAVEAVPLNTGGATALEIALMPNAASLYGIEDEDTYPYLNPFFLTQQEQDYLDNNPEGLSANQLQALKKRAFALRGPTGLGGSDESYDAVDFQNMALALLQPNPVETLLVGDPGNWPDAPNGWTLPLGLGNTVLPSFHRPALINYWQSRATVYSEPNLLRKILMRPSWLDHPNFTGSNPEWASISGNLLNAMRQASGNPLADAEVLRYSNQLLQRSIFGPWDVDNDLDGYRDSVWVDIGLPVMENTDGRLVKPLAALLVLDMDGRLNLNAHGSEDIALPYDFNQLDGELAGGVDTDNLAQGQGYGPAEISLNPLMFGNDIVDRRAWTKRVLQGVQPDESFDALVAEGLRPLPNAGVRRFRRRVVGKYGQRPFPNDRNSRPLPGVDNLTVFDIAAQLKMQGVPPRAAAFNGDQAPLQLGSYVTPPDFKGRYALGLDALGRPVYEAMFDSFGFNTRPAVRAARSLQENTPYEIDLSLSGSRGPSELAPDGPYTIAELERILRPYDADAGTLPSRIWEFAGEFKDGSADTTPNLQQLNLWRTSVTTDSYDMPVPSVVVPEWMRLGPNGTDDIQTTNTDFSDDFDEVVDVPIGAATFADLLRYRLHLALNPNNPADLPARQVRNIRLIHLPKLLPPDLANGLRLDINRPLGNGRDDNGNGVDDDNDGQTDEIGESEFDADGGFSGVVGVVDEPGEDEGPYWASTEPRLAAFTDNDDDSNDPYSFTGRFRDNRILLEDRDNNGVVDNIDRASIGVSGDMTTGFVIDTADERISVHNQRRQLLARDLYIMAMALVDPLENPTPERSRIRARRLAQWAINIVDFRDPDNIMTAFEYDETPFNGWEVDGNTATPNNDVAGPDGQIGNSDDVGGIVWGAEAQELVMTETMAWHDRRTEDTNFESIDPNVDPTGKPELLDVSTDADDNFDQFRRPRGACFVELYCPLPANPAANVDTHAIGDGRSDLDNDGQPDEAGRDLGINLRAVDRASGNSPVWRISVFQRPQNIDSIYCADWDPDSPFDEERPVDSTGNPADPDRSVYFAQIDESDPVQLTNLKNMDASDGVEFFTTLAVPSVRPGRYLVVGSGEEQDGNGNKRLGQPLNQRIYGANIGDKGGTTNVRRRIELRPNDLRNPIRLVEPSSGPGKPRSVREDAVLDPLDNTRAICDVAVITNALSAAGPTALDRRFTITEPARGYPGDDPVNYPPSGPTFYDGDPIQEGRYGNPAIPSAYDDPHDDNRQDGETRLSYKSYDPDDPLVVECYSVLCLQRLANPLLPYNKDTNPYRTVDSMSANVSLFNGLAGDPIHPGSEFYQPNPDGGAATRIEYKSDNAAVHFASLQRGFAQNQIARASNPTDANPYAANVLGYEPPSLATREPLPQDPIQLRSYNRAENRLAKRQQIGVQSLPMNQYSGALPINPPVGYGKFTPDGTTRHAFNAIPDMTLGRINQGYMSVADQNTLLLRRADMLTNEAVYLAPEEPFPWLTWNNRPFANSAELMLVPRSNSSNLLKEFSGVVNRKADGSLVDAYAKADVPLPTSPPPNNGAPAPGPGAALGTGPRYLGQRSQGTFGHLPNMKLSEVPENTRLSDVPAGFYRVMDYVHVSSPFVGTESWLNPAAFGNANNPVVSANDPRYGLQPPFNNVSAYREPGRININTVVSADVWEGGVLHRELIDPSKAWGEQLDAPLDTLFPPGVNLYLTSKLNNPQMPENAATNPRRYFHAGPNAFQLTDSRRGYGPANSPGFLLNGDSPTFFENPFRAADAANLVPIATMLQDDMGMDRKGAQVTVLRPDESSTQTTKPALLSGNTVDDDTTPAVVENLFRDSERHAAFRFQPMTRLSSMTTNRSNVYAVWVTIGFFEVQEAPDINTFQLMNDPANNLSVEQLTALYERVYPEGYQFGKEAGSDTGDIRRVREFAVIDRTIPVAFEPGENHNVDKTIRLRTRIE